MSNKKSGVGKFIVGLGLGAGLGLLFAPKKGSETREDLKKKLDEMVNKIKDIDMNEVKEEFFNKVSDIKQELDDLDKEKVKKIAKEKSEDLKKKCGELVQLAKEKGTPVLENVANEVREKAIAVTKEVLNRLEKTEEKAK